MVFEFWDPYFHRSIDFGLSYAGSQDLAATKATEASTDGCLCPWWFVSCLNLTQLTRTNAFITLQCHDH